MKNKFKFGFFGTPDVASETLEILKQNGFLPSLIITSPDAKRGRGLHMQASPVAVFAEKNNIPCIQPENNAQLHAIFSSEEFGLAVRSEKKLHEAKYDLFIVVAYGKIIPEKILNTPKLGSINIHYSLLPKYRGASPIESAILNSGTETGVTIQRMEYKMDSGPILVQEKVEIFPDEKTPELRKRLIKQGGELLVKILPDFVEGKIKPIPQDEKGATYCQKIKKENGLVNLTDFGGEPPSVLYNKFRAYAGWPRIFFFKNNKRIIITDATLENDPLDSVRGKKFVIKKILPEGKKEMDYKKLIF